jgi:hypothetical protein
MVFIIKARLNCLFYSNLILDAVYPQRKLLTHASSSQIRACAVIGLPFFVFLGAKAHLHFDFHRQSSL